MRPAPAPRSVASTPVAERDLPPSAYRGLSRRAFLRASGASAAAVAAAPLLAGCEPRPGDRTPWRQSFTTPGSRDVTVVDAGGWCWFSEARTLITPSQRLYVGTVASGTGTARDGAIEVASIDVGGGLRPGGAVRRATVERAVSTIGQDRVDDHNNPGLELTASGGVVAMWSAHGRETLLRSAVDVGGTGAFGPPSAIDRPDSAVWPGRGVSYGSVHRLPGAGVLLAAYRGEQYSWNLLRSGDDGATWEPMGLLLVPPTAGERPYAKFASDGHRLWFACTEGHPRTYQPTSIRVGVIDAAGGVTDADGQPLGQVGPGVPVLSVPFAYRCPSNADAWISEIRLVAGRPVLSVSLRGPKVSSAAGTWDHSQLRVVRDGSGWVREAVARGGGELGGNVGEPDYSGLAAIDPSTHNRFVVATNVHPTSGAPLRSRADGRVHFELWEMNRSGDGSGRWVPSALTRDSPHDNIRPHIALQGGTKILSWMQGTYRSPHVYATRIVARQAA